MNQEVPYAAELGERVLASLYQENSGNPYKRQGYIADLAMEARFQAAEKPFELCDFSNKYGLCKLDKGHAGSHTVVDLGKDD